MSHLLPLILLLLCSCARLKTAVTSELTSPQVWAPLAGAAVIHATQADKPLSDWAREQRPVFGNRDRAEKRSDQFNDVLEYGSYVSLALAPTWREHEGWKNKVAQKGKEWLTMEGGTRASYWTVQYLKREIWRERPSGQDNFSMPSGHAAAAGSWRKALMNNAGNFGDGDHPWLEATGTALAAGTLWARVEAGKHYPTDVLVGYAVGNFLTGAVWRAVFPEHETEGTVTFSFLQDVTMLGYTMPF